MKEVFANFMAAKIVNPSFPEVNHELRFLLAHYPAAYDVDRTLGTNPIRQTLDNLNEAGSLYGAIIYQKAPIVMRHLESLMGEEAFRDGLREYLKTFAFKNATWLDLIAMLDTRTPLDLASWSKVWVEEAGRPVIATELEVEGGRVRSLAFRQRDPLNRERRWPEQLRVTLGYLQPNESRVLTVDLAHERVDVKEAIGLAAPLYVLPNGGGWAYGGFTVDPASACGGVSSRPRSGPPARRPSRRCCAKPWWPHRRRVSRPRGLARSGTSPCDRTRSRGCAACGRAKRPFVG
jgi:aminopeptidase N